MAGRVEPGSGWRRGASNCRSGNKGAVLDLRLKIFHGWPIMGFRIHPYYGRDAIACLFLVGYGR